MALRTRQPGAALGLVSQSDAGSQYTSQDYQQQLTDARVASIRTVGDAYDNALAESFLDTVKTELIADRVWRTRSQLELAVVEYVAWLNSARLHSALGYRTPDELEAEWRFASQPTPAVKPPAQPTPNTGDAGYDPSGVVCDRRC